MALVNRLHHPVTALGPGRRAGIWLQGCTIGCPGCASGDTWTADPAQAMPVSEILGWISAIDDGTLDGVTITGGEPFEQPEALAALLAGLDGHRTRCNPDLDFLCFSGHPLARLRRRHPDMLDRLDAIVAGPYVRTRPTRRIWCGSENQRITALSAQGRRRYAPFVDLEVDRAPLQVTVDEGVWVIGVPQPGDLLRLQERLAARGITLTGPSWS
jgi:anaerobic ribonucleoside-triphosphate reductase activating protein